MSHLLPRRCSRKECGKMATHFAGVVVYASHGSGAPSILDLPLCPEHAHALRVEDIITDSTWNAIVKSLRAMRKADPIRSKTQVYVTPIDEAPDFFRNKYEPARGGS